MPPVPPALSRWWPAAAPATRSTAPVSVPSSPAAPALVPVRSGTPPQAGEVELVAGPFTDRVRLEQAQVRTGKQAAVEGSLAQLVDSSALIVAQLQVDFYGADGALLGSRQKVLRQPDITSGGVRPVGGDARYGGDIDFSVQAPAQYADEVRAALLSVPTLVNE